MGIIKAIVEGAKATGSEAVDLAGDAFGALKNVLNYNRDGAQIADIISDIPSAREVAGLSSIPEAGAFSNIKSEQANLLRNHFSQGYLSNETLPPEQITISDLKGKTLMSIVGDPTGRHTVTNLQGRNLPEPVDSMAGFEYTDIPGQGYAGAEGATSSKLNEALRTEDPYYTSVMMAEKSGDFAMHTGELFGQMLRNQGNMPLDTKDIPKIDEAIRGMGMPIKVKVKNPDGTEKMVGRTIYPFQSFTTVADPNSVLDFLKTLPTGTLRAAFLKGMDKAGLQKMGIPSVGQTRLALADAEQIGMDWGTTGYRGFVPDLNKGSFPTTAQNSTTYDTGIDKVGRSQSFLDGSRGIPANLLYRDNAAARREAGTGGNLVMNSADYKVLESSPKKAKQLVDDQLDEIISTFTEIERRGGRRASLQYAQELLSGGKITGQMIEAARKANIPSWMLAAIAPSLGALSGMGENKEGGI